MALPKLKTEAKIGARPSTGSITKRASDYDIAFVTGLAFRNSEQTVAVCITPTGKDPRESGLHLTTGAAVELVSELTHAAGANEGAVEVTNHQGGREQLWQRFSQQDAVFLADRLAAVAGH